MLADSDTFAIAARLSWFNFPEQQSARFLGTYNWLGVDSTRAEARGVYVQMGETRIKKFHETEGPLVLGEHEGETWASQVREDLAERTETDRTLKAAVLQVGSWDQPQQPLGAFRNVGSWAHPRTAGSETGSKVQPSAL